jgi:type II secretory pathway pseudopilin PulG
MTTKKIKFFKNNPGYSLVEMIIYISVLSIISILSINTILSFTRSYRDLGALRIVEHSGTDAMERMTRDIRSASSIDMANSSFGTNPGILSIITTVDGVSTVKKFYVQDNIIKVDVGGTYFGPLTLSNASVTSLTFRQLNSGISDAVKIDMTISGTVGEITKTNTYHSTIILKGK